MRGHNRDGKGKNPNSRDGDLCLQYKMQVEGNVMKNQSPSITHIIVVRDQAHKEEQLSYEYKKGKADKTISSTRLTKFFLDS